MQPPPLCLGYGNVRTSFHNVALKPRLSFTLLCSSKGCPCLSHVPLLQEDCEHLLRIFQTGACSRGSPGHWNIDPQLFLVPHWSRLFLASLIFVFNILVTFPACLFSYFSMLCNIPLMTFFQGTQRTRWFSPPPTQPLEARGSPPFFSEVRNSLAPGQLCFSSCQAAADQIFLYTLKIHTQQSVSVHSRLEARSKRNKSTWNLRTQSGYEHTERQAQPFYYAAKCQASGWE